MRLGWASIIKILLSNPFCFEIKISFHGVVLYCFSTKKIVCIQIAKMGFWCRGHDLRSDAKITWQRLVTRDASVTPCHENCHNFDTTLTQALVTCHWWRFERQIASDSFVNLCIRCIDVIIVLFIWDLTKMLKCTLRPVIYPRDGRKNLSITEQTMWWGQKVPQHRADGGRSAVMLHDSAIELTLSGGSWI